jgi:hypothetical protein
VLLHFLIGFSRAGWFVVIIFVIDLTPLGSVRTRGKTFAGMTKKEKRLPYLERLFDKLSL